MCVHYTRILYHTRYTVACRGQNARLILSNQRRCNARKKQRASKNRTMCTHRAVVCADRSNNPLQVHCAFEESSSGSSELHHQKKNSFPLCLIARLWRLVQICLWWSNRSTTKLVSKFNLVFLLVLMKINFLLFLSNQIRSTILPIQFGSSKSHPLDLQRSQGKFKENEFWFSGCWSAGRVWIVRMISKVRIYIQTVTVYFC